MLGKKLSVGALNEFGLGWGRELFLLSQVRGILMIPFVCRAGHYSIFE